MKMLQNPHILLTFDKVHNPLRLPRETTSERPKVVQTPGAFNILTSKCASRHNSVHFFDVATSKSAPRMVCFVHFQVKMLKTPHVRATTACTFSTSQLPKVVRQWCVLCILTWRCASRHNGVHFFDISTSKSGPRLVCFVHFDFEMCFAHFFDIATSKSGPRLVCFVHFDLEMCFATQRRAVFHLSSGQLAPHPPL